MRLFLDTSVLLAACGSATGASRELCRRAAANGWTLVATPYVVDEVVRNLDRLPVGSTEAWNSIQPGLVVMPDVLTIDRPAVFGPAKDRPILFSALAWSDVLLTLDRGDFSGMLDQSFYALRVMKPGTFLEAERTAGRV